MNLVVPENDSEWREHFELARAQPQAHGARLHGVRAHALSADATPARGAWRSSGRWKEVSGEGTIYSYEIVHHAIQPGFKEWTPYAVVLVELDEQRGEPTPDEALRIIANLVTPDSAGGRRPTWRSASGCAWSSRTSPTDFALPQFTLTDEPPEGRVWRLPE